MRARHNRVRVEIKYSLFHGPKEPLGLLVEGHSHPVELGHLLCHLCRDAGITQLQCVQFTTLMTGDIFEAVRGTVNAVKMSDVFKGPVGKIWLGLCFHRGKILTYKSIHQKAYSHFTIKSNSVFQSSEGFTNIWDIPSIKLLVSCHLKQPFSKEPVWEMQKAPSDELPSIFTHWTLK